jgi:hypothetical protein
MARKRVILYSIIVVLSYAICVVTDSRTVLAVMGFSACIWAIYLGVLIERQWPGLFFPSREQR